MSPLNKEGYLIMINKYKGLAEFFASSIIIVAFSILRFAKFSPIIGAAGSFFSLSDVAMPLTGTLGLGFCICAALARLGTKMVLTGIPFIKAGFYLPGLCAAGCWTERKMLFQVAIPLTAMVLFIMHPVGFYAAPYSFYWLIPVIIYWLDRDSVFLYSLASTFVAHAVGSVIWLYVFNLSVQTWLGLIPVVAVERLFFASAMTVMYITVLETKRFFVSKIFSSSQLA